MITDINDIAGWLKLDATFIPGCVEFLMIDSRSVVNPEKTLFVALRTPNNDGHGYIKDLIDKGVRNFIVQYVPDAVKNMPGVNFLVVDNTLDSLRKIGMACRGRFKGIVVGITGSRGKTMVKEGIFQSLYNLRKVSRSPRSYNSQIGVPLSMWMSDSQADIVVIEAGVSQKGEMERLAEIILPDIGIFTCITDEHDAGFAGKEEKIREKLKLFVSSQVIIYNSADEDIERIIREVYGEKKLIGVKVDSPDENVGFVKALLEILDIKGVLPQELSSGIAQAVTRLNVIDGVNNCKLVYDRFTPDTVSLRGALDFMNRQVSDCMKRTLILAGEGFLGTEKDIAALSKEYRLDRVIRVGPEGANLTTDDFYNEIILLKGSREACLDNLYAMLEAKQHETLMEVNLDSLIHNFNFFRSKIKPQTGVICMLKAHGYGAGSVELARALQSQGAAYLAVAVVDEGVELRHAGIKMPVMVLNPRAQNHKIMFDYRLEPEVYSFEMLDEIIDSARRYGVTGFPIHIKLETGMRRLGFIEEDLMKLGSKLRNCNEVKAASVFSHLACADDPAEDDYTRSQFDYFARCCSILDSMLPQKPKRHILNSTGIIRFPEYQYDYVRLGIGLYGVPTLDDGSMSDLRNVSSLTSPIISLKRWKAGTTVGYNRRGKLTRDSVIATIPVGYADGIDRHLGYGNACFRVNGTDCPTVGSICMDICMIDVTDAECKVGDRVELFGSAVTPASLAAILGTIPYEILTSVSPRVKRVYFRE